MTDLASDILAFCDRHGMARTKFGQLALNDKPFVDQLVSKGRRVWPDTEKKVRAFMDAYVPERTAAPSEPTVGEAA